MITAHGLRAALAGKATGIQYVGGYTTSFAGQTTNRVVTFGGNLTGGIATGASTNDLVIVYFATGSIADRDLVVSGYTEITEVYTNDVYDTNLVVARKFMGATPDTTVTLTGGTLNNNDAGAIAIQVWRGVNQTTPLDVAAVVQGDGRIDTVEPNPPPITPITAGAYIVAGGAGAHAANDVRTFSSSDLSDFKSSCGLDTNDVTIGLGYYQWTSGEFNPAKFTFSGTDTNDYSNHSVTLALRPA